jgi:hypothetical protein
MMSVLSQKIYVLMMLVCRNGSNDTKEMQIHKPPTLLFTKETKFIVAQILYMHDRRPRALEILGLANNPLLSRSRFTIVKSDIRLQLLSSQSSNGRQMVIDNRH